MCCVKKLGSFPVTGKDAFGYVVIGQCHLCVCLSASLFDVFSHVTVSLLFVC